MIHLQFKVSPFVEEEQSSGQTNEQQADAEHGGDYLLLRHRLSDELQVATAGAVEARLTPESQETGEIPEALSLSLTHSHTHMCVLAVVLIDVHQQHALSLIHAVMLKRAVAVASGPLSHTGAHFLSCYSETGVKEAAAL